MNKRSVGTAYEDRACEYLKQKGYRIRERNFTCRLGEIDIIAGKGRMLVFVEVKYRRKTSCGYSLEAVDVRKQRKISRTAVFYLLRNGLTENTPCRFDIVAIDGERIRHIENAFLYME